MVCFLSLSSRLLFSSNFYMKKHKSKKFRKGEEGGGERPAQHCRVNTDGLSQNKQQQ